jgi:hypothetical protein
MTLPGGAEKLAPEVSFGKRLRIFVGATLAGHQAQRMALFPIRREVHLRKVDGWLNIEMNLQPLFPT